MTNPSEGIRADENEWVSLDGSQTVEPTSTNGTESVYDYKRRPGGMYYVYVSAVVHTTNGRISRIRLNAESGTARDSTRLQHDVSVMIGHMEEENYGPPMGGYLTLRVEDMPTWKPSDQITIATWIHRKGPRCSVILDVEAVDSVNVAPDVFERRVTVRPYVLIW